MFSTLARDCFRVVCAAVFVCCFYIVCRTFLLRSGWNVFNITLFYFFLKSDKRYWTVSEVVEVVKFGLNAEKQTSCCLELRHGGSWFAECVFVGDKIKEYPRNKKNNQRKEKKYTMEDQFSVLGSNFIRFLAEICLTRFTKHPYCKCNAAAI